MFAFVYLTGFATLALFADGGAGLVGVILYGFCIALFFVLYIMHEILTYLKLTGSGLLVVSIILMSLVICVLCYIFLLIAG